MTVVGVGGLENVTLLVCQSKFEELVGTASNVLKTDLHDLQLSDPQDIQELVSYSWFS